MRQINSVSPTYWRAEGRLSSVYLEAYRHSELRQSIKATHINFQPLSDKENWLSSALSLRSLCSLRKATDRTALRLLLRKLAHPCFIFFISIPSVWARFIFFHILHHSFATFSLFHYSPFPRSCFSISFVTYFSFPTAPFLWHAGDLFSGLSSPWLPLSSGFQRLWSDTVCNVWGFAQGWGGASSTWEDGVSVWGTAPEER